jgi:hypothetical protein
MKTENLKMLNPKQMHEILSYLQADSGRSVRAEKVKVWHDQFSNIDYETAWKAAKHLNIKGYKEWEPRAQDFRDSLAAVTETENISGDEAYQQALAAVARYGSYREKEALESLPLRTRIALQRFGYIELCMSDVSKNSVHRAQFARIYEAVKERESFQRSSSADILKTIPAVKKLLDVKEKQAA